MLLMIIFWYLFINLLKMFIIDKNEHRVVKNGIPPHGAPNIVWGPMRRNTRIFRFGAM
ncbi:hypothetical protein A0H76_3022 [Hepatospora eriocheir]|uniref:Uncharacterized protein n=1 Tax=Hepatospora eriocheir TaxID=1081669 RepID=A0A1X0QIF1_9MICR|nr:hypothetical protein A0H76_3022 [Hepatospora eriocheir]